MVGDTGPSGWHAHIRAESVALPAGEGEDTISTHCGWFPLVSSRGSQNAREQKSHG